MITACISWEKTAGVASSAAAEFAVDPFNCSYETTPPGVHFYQ